MLICGWATLAFDLSSVVAEEPPPVDQMALNIMVSTDPASAFEFAFEAGDELTEAVFTTARGVGANVGNNGRFTRFPRADLRGPGQWAAHIPPREGGPQAQSCIACHALPMANGAGALAVNVAVDPLQTGDPAAYLERNTLHLFGLGGVQRVAEEMTAELQAIAAEVTAQACADEQAASAPLSAKGVDFGKITIIPRLQDGGCTGQIDAEQIEGVDHDLVVRMFGWKGTAASIREFSRNAAHNEMGMQADELVGSVDGDHDGVVGELTIGDLTALAVYMAALARPTSKLELDELGVMPITFADRRSIQAGERSFREIGCAECHRPTMTIDEPIFSEPSLLPQFADTVLPSGVIAEHVGLSQTTAVQFDLTADQPNNHIELADGTVHNAGSLRRDVQGRAVLEWYSDFKRHDMGASLADPMDAFGFGASVWPTRSLAGVGSTGPWLHNGQATTLHEAIMQHGGEAKASCDNYEALTHTEQEQVIAFLENLVIVDLDPEEH